jgi:hypothetical protein
MSRTVTRLLVLVALVGCIATIVPSTTAGAMAVCTAKPVGTFQGGNTIAVTGAYTAAGATSVSLTCGVVYNGFTVARFSEKVPGPVAAVAGETSQGSGAVSSCYELYVTYVNQPPTSSDTCP